MSVMGVRVRRNGIKKPRRETCHELVFTRLAHLPLTHIVSYPSSNTLATTMASAHRGQPAALSTWQKRMYHPSLNPPIHLLIKLKPKKKRALQSSSCAFLAFFLPVSTHKCINLLTF